MLIIGAPWRQVSHERRDITVTLVFTIIFVEQFAPVTGLSKENNLVIGTSPLRCFFIIIN